MSEIQGVILALVLFGLGILINKWIDLQHEKRSGKK